VYSLWRLTVSSTASAVALKNVSKHFGAVRAVDGIDLDLAVGEITALLGPNGAGKTTTIDMILGLGKPDTGTVEVLGMKPAAAIGRGLISAVMQSGGLLKDLTVAETVRLTATLFPESRPVHEVLERAGIDDIANRLVGKCSGGQQQRLRFALALLPDPALMVLDEPTSGMDVEGRRDFWKAIRADAEQGRTVLFATHYLEEADAYADRIVLMRQGKIVADGSGAEVKNLAVGRSVRATLPGASDSALRALPGVLTVEIRGDRVILQTKDSDAVARYLLTATPARDVEIVAHNLEDAFLALTGDGAASSENQDQDGAAVRAAGQATGGAGR
jgi:ABC-2 type transport system ATP-binding protein